MRWADAGLLLLTYLAAALLNARAVVFGGRPVALGVAASVAYLAAWLVHAYLAGRRRNCGTLRRMAVAWAVVISGTVICSTVVRVNFGTWAAIPGGWVVPAILFAVAAPLYGLAALFPVNPLVALTGVTVGAAALTLVIAVTARRARPA